MIIDNKKDRYPDDGLDITTVSHFIDNYAGNGHDEKGRFDIVTGYFTLRALAHLHDGLPADDAFRIVSSEMLRRDDSRPHIIDLLGGDLGIDSVLRLDEYARKAKAFLERPDVDMRALTQAFCHAKMYQFTNSNGRSSSFYITGSSNLTEAGLGLIPSANVELNIAEAVNRSNGEFRELQRWFTDTWKAAAAEMIIDDGDRKERLPVKQYFIRMIESFMSLYTPRQIYYKILFELFRADIDIDISPEHERDMSLLQDSTIWNTLYDYQRNGVVSLIKMLRRYGGAILADAVGLGKTFSALAVVKYFQTQGYTTLLLCPKKLQENWEQYLHRRGSRFEQDDFSYIVRFHTDLGGERLQTAYGEAPLTWITAQQKLLVVIDESHNLRNDKSKRYRYLMEKIVSPDAGRRGRDVKVLMLSATPVNTGLHDLRGQFALIARGNDAAFDGDDFGVPGIANLFRESQRRYNEWTKERQPTVGRLISRLQPELFNLTDRLIVARTRSLIEHTLGEDLGFPRKNKPVNIYQGVEHFGSFANAADIYAAFESLSLTAYQPSLYMAPSKQKNKARLKAETQWGSDINRERFLVRMMSVLFVKRLESSWASCLSTIKKVLDAHTDILDKALAYRDRRDAAAATVDIDPEHDLGEDIDEEETEYFSLRKGEIRLADLLNLNGFIRGLQQDKNRLTEIYRALCDFRDKYDKGEEHDPKLDELADILQRKQKKANKKTVVFTSFTDTATFIYDELQRRGFTHMACVTGSSTRTTGKHSTNRFTEVLQSFAPYSKLYKELDWADLYADYLNRADYCDADGRWNVPYDLWLKLVREHRKDIARLVDDPVDILIATDCLSEGQNLQDADLQINYDIHWNPVRIIQRFGRIDRIGSPNETIQCVNFWPTKSINDYLNLQQRIENRMAAMEMVGVETTDLTEHFSQMIKDNPLTEKNAERLLRQFAENSIADIEQPQTLTLCDLSLETFRQDLVDYLEHNKDEFMSMPPGIFSGFQVQDNLFEHYNECLVAVVGYPHRQTGAATAYTDIYLMCQPVDAEPSFTELNRAEVLSLLRNHKEAERYVPAWIDRPQNDDKATERLRRLSAMVSAWMTMKMPRQRQSDVLDLFAGKNDTVINDARYNMDNYDLIAWEYVTKTKN